jgi:predicted HTH transcriptional regulator
MVIAKSIVCFLNSRKGGTLLIGVADDKSILGLENDFKKSPLRNKNEDGEIYIQTI